ncbi:hypothetical protein EG329_012823 [Mollisiaceae sp. DMI_Dod_QoI]|nr:hypothetical protein EG329_012823 [Helotiales sp. DMI_Dod_QoI]
MDAETVEMYFSYPKEGASKGAIVVLTDVVGHRFTNLQLIADQFAANGYVAVMPDLFHGDAIPLNHSKDFDFMKWMDPAHLPPTVEPIIESAIRYIRDEMGIERVGGAGYCFGAKYVVRYLTEGNLDVGFIAHPSLVEAEELKAIQKPLSVVAAENDPVFPPPKRHESEEILLGLEPLPYQISLYGGTAHGFAVRGDITIPRVRVAKEHAFFQAVAWFDEYLPA